MRRPWPVLVVCCGILASEPQGHAADSPGGEHSEADLHLPTPIPIGRLKPPAPTDSVDIAVRPDLGRKGLWWGFIGSFELHEKGGSKLVALYYFDSDQNRLGFSSVPNSFSLHAATRDSQGRWVTHQVYSCSRCHFARVLNRDKSSVAVQLQPAFELIADPKWSPAEREQWYRVVAKANTPFTVTLALRDGRAVATQAAPR